MYSSWSDVVCVYVGACPSVYVSMYGRLAALGGFVQMWLPGALLPVSGSDELEPLPQSITQRLRQGVDITQDHIKRKRELVHVGADLWQFARSFKDGHFDIQYRILEQGHGRVMSTEKH